MHWLFSSCATYCNLPAGSWKQAPFATSQEGNSMQHAVARRSLYEQMSKELQAKGLTLGGIITQGLKQQDLFVVEPPAGAWAMRGHIKPILHALQVSCRSKHHPVQESGSYCSSRPNFMKDKALCGCNNIKQQWRAPRKQPAAASGSDRPTL
jgi:hypothetical protein